MAPLQRLFQEGTIDCVCIKWETLMRQPARTAFPCLTRCAQQGRAGEERARSVRAVNEAGAWPKQHRGQKSSCLVEERGILRSVAVRSCSLPAGIEGSSLLSPQSILLCCGQGKGQKALGSCCPHPEKGKGCSSTGHQTPSDLVRGQASPLSSSGSYSNSPLVGVWGARAGNPQP